MGANWHFKLHQLCKSWLKIASYSQWSIYCEQRTEPRNGGKKTIRTVMHLVVKAVQWQVHFCLIYSLVLTPSTSVFICFGISCDSDDARWAIAVWHPLSFKGGQAGGVGQKADKSAIKCMQMKPQVITSAGVCIKVWACVWSCLFGHVYEPAVQAQL